MTLTQLFLEELDREATRTRRTVERVPGGRDAWTPHAKPRPPGRPGRVDAFLNHAHNHAGRADPAAARRQRPISAACHERARPGARSARGQGARIAVEHERRVPADDELA